MGARSAVWQERSVVQVIDSVFTTYQAHAAWAWSPCALAHLGESHQGGQRSTTVQYRETDLAFVQRILAREGLVFRFEAVEQTPLGHRLVILADTTQAASCPEDPTSVGAGGIRCLFGDARTTNAADVAPWLLTCPTNRIDSWLPRSFALAKESPSVTWLFGMLTADQLRTRMAKRLEVVFKDGTELMLRFFDPRILSELNSAFSVETHRHFFSLCERWCSLDRNGALFEVTSQFVATNDPLSTALILKESEEHALLLASEAGQVLAETLKRWPDDLQKIGPVARFNLSKDCCSEASNADFDNLADKVLLLMHVAAQARGYLKTHEWFALRAMLASGERTLLSLFEAKDATP